MSSLNCVICDEKVTASKQTSCPYCKFNACRTCVRKYVLNETDTKCMNCKKVWTRAHQNEILLPTFVNGDLRAHHEQILYEREMALFPTTIEEIEQRRITNRLLHDYRVSYEKISVKHSNLRYLHAIMRENDKLIEQHTASPKLYSDIDVVKIAEENREIGLKLKSEKAEYEKFQVTHRVIRGLMDMEVDDRKIVMANYIEGADPVEILETLKHSGQLGEASKRARTQFVRACPIESCRGFLSQQWKCGICNVFTCSKCNVPKTQTQGDEHVCNPDDIATAELLSKDTKPCPRCGTGIFKIDGCDQMWCVECRTAFSWRTGNLETGHFHNPHYFEYQRRIGADARNILDMPCNAMAPDQFHGVVHHLVHIAVSNASCIPADREKHGLKPFPKELRHLISIRASDYSQSIGQFAERVLPRFRPDAIQNNLELRVQYLTEQISKDGFKSALIREAKQFERKIEIGQVVQTVIFGMSDILTRLVNHMRESRTRHPELIFCDPDPMLAMFSEIDALIDYANECLEIICKQYKLTRVAIFVRNDSKHHNAGLYTVRVSEIDTPEGKQQVMTQVRAM